MVYLGDGRIQKKFRRPIGEAHGRVEVAMSGPWRLRLSARLNMKR
jgi:hypothetical protein